MTHKYQIKDTVSIDKFWNIDPKREVIIGGNTWAELQQNCNDLAQQIADDFGKTLADVKFDHIKFRNGKFWPF